MQIMTTSSMAPRFRIVISLTLLSACCCAEIFSQTVSQRQPRHVHLSFGEHPGEMVVTWSTVEDTEASVVEYGTTSHDFNFRAEGNRNLFVDDGPLKLSQYIHRVIIKDLQPGQTYYYHCGSDYGWSKTFAFTNTRTDPDWSPRLAVFGDMGIENAKSLPRLQKDTHSGLYDAILHVGDMAYDMYEHDGRVGDYFMDLIEPIAAYVPYMTCVGNHENSYNFSHYRARFSMPGGHENMMYSFNMGPAHIVAISTEFYYFMRYGVKQVVKQYEWLVQDLVIRKRMLRRIVAFDHGLSLSAIDPCIALIRDPMIALGKVILYGRGFHCFAGNSDLVNLDKKAVAISHRFGLEKLFYDNRVDLSLWGHEHSYERLWPVYDGQVMNGSVEEPYRNPQAPVHVVTGSAGCREHTSGFKPEIPPWSAFRKTDYGYARLHVANKTHLYLEQVSDDKNGAVIDSFWMVKDQRLSNQRFS